MKNFLLLFCLSLFACVNPTKEDTNTISDQADQQAPIRIDLTDNPELLYKNLQIFPVFAEKEFTDNHQFAAGFINLKEGINTKGFRITEKKPFGRSGDEGAVNALTIQNKSQDTVYIMAGDIVEGGQQDRMIAEDMVVPPRTIRDIPVFCVERGRWYYKDESGNEIDPQIAIQNKKINAFTAYYNVASNDLRKIMQSTKNQQAVWNKISELTAIHNAESLTAAYTGLENAEEFIALRNEYTAYFTGKLNELENVVGMMAISGNKMIGTDLFCHPDLFKKQYEVLLHAYITEAISNGKPVNIGPKTLQIQAEKIINNFSLNPNKEPGTLFKYHGKMVHFSHL